MRFVGTGGAEVVTKSDMPVSAFVLSGESQVFEHYSVAMQVRVDANVCDSWAEFLGYLYTSDTGRVALDMPTDVVARTVKGEDGMIQDIHPTAVFAPGTKFYDSERAACLELAVRNGCLV